MSEYDRPMSTKECVQHARKFAQMYLDGIVPFDWAQRQAQSYGITLTLGPPREDAIYLERHR